MALTSLLESKSANIDFFQKTIEYLINRTYVRLVFGFLLFLPASTIVPRFLPFLPFSISFFLAPITGVKIDKTDTSFLTLDSSFENIC